MGYDNILIHSSVKFIATDKEPRTAGMPSRSLLTYTTFFRWFTSV